MHQGDEMSSIKMHPLFDETFQAVIAGLIFIQLFKIALCLSLCIRLDPVFLNCMLVIMESPFLCQRHCHFDVIVHVILFLTQFLGTNE